MDAASPPAAHVPCMSTARPFVPARPAFRTSEAARSRPSKGCPRKAITRCRRPGSPSRCRSALRHLLGDPGRLQRVIAFLGQPFDGRDLAASDVRKAGLAGTNGLAVDMHGTCAAGGDAASILGPGELQMLANDPK